MHTQTHSMAMATSRRNLLATAGIAAGAAALASTPAAMAQQSAASAPPARAGEGYVTASDGARLYYKDWGSGQPIVFHHGWPLSSDEWDGQMLYFLDKGFRVVAMDRRGHGRSSQIATGHDMATYAADVDVLVKALDLRDAIHVGHSTGGGEATAYVARHGEGRVAKLVLVSAVPPLMLKTEGNPGGLPISVFDGFRADLAKNRAEYYWQVPLPFYGFNREGTPIIEGVRLNWWRQSMMGSAKAHHDGIAAFSETDQTGDLKAITVPTLILHGDDDQIVPYRDAALRQAELLPHNTLKTYPGFPHGMPTTEAATINADMLEFFRS